MILIHANPDPWGHPSSRYTPEGRALPADQHDEMDRQFEALLEELSASGECRGRGPGGPGGPAAVRAGPRRPGAARGPAHPPNEALLAPAADTPDSTAHDDSLALLLLCCHPALTRPSQVALTLRAVAGLSTAQIARAFLVPEATMAQRISRAKTRLRQVGARFTLPVAEQLPVRVAAVAQVLSVIFTEGHTATTGERPVGGTGEARVGYATAARLATSIPEQRYLNDKAAPGEERHG